MRGHLLPKVITLSEASEISGKATNTLRRWVRDGWLPAEHRSARLILLDRAEFERLWPEIALRMADRKNTATRGSTMADGFGRPVVRTQAYLEAQKRHNDKRNAAARAARAAKKESQ
jgi:hypothetical protein